MSRAVAAQTAVTVTDRTCHHVFGVPWRTLRTWCLNQGITIGRIGRRPVVRVADVLAALEGGSANEPYDEARVIEMAARPKRRQ